MNMSRLKILTFISLIFLSCSNIFCMSPSSRKNHTHLIKDQEYFNKLYSDFIKAQKKDYFQRSIPYSKDVILNFWATWCTPCIREFKHFKKISKDYDINIVLINVDDDLSEKAYRNFLIKHKIEDFHHIKDPKSKISDEFKVDRLPTTFIFNKQQKLLYHIKKEFKENPSSIGINIEPRKKSQE